MMERRPGAIRGQRSCRASTVIFDALCFFFPSFLFSLTFDLMEKEPPRLVSSELTILQICSPKYRLWGFISTRYRCHLVTQCVGCWQWTLMSSWHILFQEF